MAHQGSGADEGLHLLRISVLLGSVGETVMGVGSTIVVALFHDVILARMRGTQSAKLAVLNFMLCIDVFMIVAGSVGLASSWSRDAVKAARPKVRQFARSKLACELVLLLCAAIMSCIVGVWLSTLPGVTALSWLGRWLGTLPSMVFQSLWVRTCLLYYRIEAAHRGSLAVLPSMPVLPDVELGPDEPLLPRGSGEDDEEAPGQGSGRSGRHIPGQAEGSLGRYISRLPSLLSAVVGSGGSPVPSLKDAATASGGSPPVGVDSDQLAAAAKAVPETAAAGPFVTEPPPATPVAQGVSPEPPVAASAWPSIVKYMSSRSSGSAAAAASQARGAFPSGRASSGFSSIISAAASSAAGRAASGASRWAAGDAPLTDTAFDGAVSSDDEVSPRAPAATRAPATGRPQQGGATSESLTLSRVLGRVWPAASQSS